MGAAPNHNRRGYAKIQSLRPIHSVESYWRKGLGMNEIYLTKDEAEKILMAVEVGSYNIDYPGNRSKLAHARLLIASRCRNCNGDHLTVDCDDTAWFFPPK